MRGMPGRTHCQLDEHNKIRHVRTYAAYWIGTLKNILGHHEHEL